MDVNKNGYIFTFATIMVVVVGLLLSGLAISLKPFQQANVSMEKKQDILSTVGYPKSETPREVADELFGKVFKEQYALKSDGSVAEEIAPFDIDLAEELKKGASERVMPIYIAEVEGEKLYVLPLRGNGLWGPIWGYVSLRQDLNTIYGASFDHKTETPGLGAEINKAFFQDQFVGKKVLEGSEVSIEVVKSNAAGDYQVDGISGGTITSKGVQSMMETCISFYLPYFNTIGGQTAMNQSLTSVN